MTFPVFIRLGPLTIHPHWLFETLAYTLAGYVYSRERRRRGDVIETRTRWWIIAAAALGGLVGSRLLSLAEDPVELGRHWSDPAFLVEGKTPVGGLIGGLIAVEWIKRRLGVVVATGDLLVLPLVAEQDDAVRQGVFKLFATNHSPESGARSLRDLLCCLPRLDAPAQLGYENIFRVLIMQFIDAYSFDVRSMKKTCVHIVHPDGRLIPFDTYNLFYRDGLEQSRLAPLRRRAERGMAELEF